MRHSLRSATTLLAIIPVVGLLSACGESGGNEATTSSDLSVSNIYQGLDGQSVSYTVANSSALFTDSLKSTLLAAFSDKTGAKVNLQNADCGITKLAAMVEAQNVSSDLWSFCNSGDYQQAIAAGLLEKIDTSVVPVDKLKADSYSDYGINGFNYATGLFYRNDAFSNSKPTSVKDFFDTKGHPGKRCILNKGLEYTSVAEAAMQVSGKSTKDVYPIDLDTVFNELDKIKGDLVFVPTVAGQYQGLANGSCVMSLNGNGSAYAFSKQNPSVPLSYTFGGAATSSAPVGIVKGAAHQKAAQALLRWYVTDNSSQVAMTAKTSYLPADLKEAPQLPAEVTPFALAGSNLDNTIKMDTMWWDKNRDTVQKAWNAWLTKQ